MLESVLRISDLLILASEVGRTNFRATFSSKSGPPAEDILRAAVVLTHAQLEDLLRTIGGVLLPLADSGVLNNVPLVGLGSQPKKFLLGELARHRGKLVDVLLQDSVVAHLDQRSLNNTRDIAQLLTEMGFDPSGFEHNFPAIQQIVRRHQIVHRADKVKRPDSDIYVPQPIHQTEVHNWLSATYKFMVDLMHALALKLCPHEELEKYLTSGSTSK